MADYKKKEKDVGVSFAYQPAEHRAAFDKTFHTKNEDGSYTYHGKYKLVTTLEELESIKNEYHNRVVAVDTETTGLTYFKDYIVGFSLAISSSVEDVAYYIPIRHKIKKVSKSESVTKLDENGEIEYTPAGRVRKHTVKEYTYRNSPHNIKAKQKYLTKYFTVIEGNIAKNEEVTNHKKYDLKQRFKNMKYELTYGTDAYDKLALDMFYDIMLNAKGIILHNAEFDLVMLQNEGYDTDKLNFFDTMVLTYQIDPEARGIAGLKAAEKHYLGRYRPDYEETLGGAENFQYTDPSESCFYGAVDPQNTYGLYEVLRPKLYSILNKHEDTLVVEGKKYDTIKKDNKLIKCFAEYYGHTPIYIDRQIAITYKEKVTHELINLRTEIYDFFKKGIFNLNTGSKEFKSAMIDQNIVTGGFTEKGNPSYGKDGLKEFGRNLKNLELYIKKENDIRYESCHLDIRYNNISLYLSKIIDTFGKDYFNGKFLTNSYRILSKDKKELSKKEFIETLKVMLEKEKIKFGVLKKIQNNSSLNKAVNSYIEKLTQVDECKMRYKLFNTKSGRLASGNGSKSDTKTKNRYYIDLNAQNLSKPKSCFFKAYKSEQEGNILGWYFEQISDEYAKEHMEDEYIVEGYSPEYNIRDCIVAPKGKIIFSKDYEAQEAKLLALLSQDSVMIENFLNGIDPHTATAYGIYGKENYNKEKRKIAKTVNFAVNYGGSYGTISDSAEIPLDEAKEILRKYEETFHEAVKWKKTQIDKVFNKSNKKYTEGVVYNAFGRPRRLGSFLRVAKRNQEEDDSMEMYRKCDGYVKSAERRVASHEIQGFAGDLCRLVLIKLYDKYFKNKNEDVDFLNAVHDEVNFYITNDKEKIMQYNREIEDLMEFKIPGWQFVINSPGLDLGYRWGSAINFIWTDSSKTDMIPKRTKG